MEKCLQTLNRQEKIAVWSERIAACRSSGISVRAWCEGNGISTASYYKSWILENMTMQIL